MPKGSKGSWFPPADDPGTHENNLREWRDLIGATQKELATMAKINSPSTISAFETGRRQPFIQEAYRLAAVFECSVQDLWPDSVQTTKETHIVRKVV